MISRRWLAYAFVFLLAPSVAGAVEGRGKAEVRTGNTMSVGGIPFRLADSIAPSPGEVCQIAGREIDCGNIARTALKDLVLGAVVHCIATGAPDLTYHTPARCTADGFDISRNMVHTGWALPAPGAPEEFKDVAKRAREQRHGLWRTTFARPRGPLVQEREKEICVAVKPAAGVECAAFTGVLGRHAGQTFSAARGSVLGDPPTGPICLCGVPAEMSICMQGKAVSVTRLKPLSKCP